jgi:16S rRNA (cytidine1402-2'-O)-methyltransferase
MARETRPVVLFASPNRLGADLTDLAGVIEPDRPVVVARELTKLHEETWSGTLAAAVERWGEADVRGEVTVVIGPGQAPVGDVDEAVSLARSLVEQGMAPSVAAREAAFATGVSRRPVYQALLEDQGRS